jgi:hypothetical protein
MPETSPFTRSGALELEDVEGTVIVAHLSFRTWETPTTAPPVAGNGAVEGVTKRHHPVDGDILMGKRQLGGAARSSDQLQHQ